MKKKLCLRSHTVNLVLFLILLTYTQQYLEAKLNTKLLPFLQQLYHINDLSNVGAFRERNDPTTLSNMWASSFKFQRNNVPSGRYPIHIVVNKTHSRKEYMQTRLQI